MGCCGHANETSSSIKGGNFLQKLTDSRLLKGYSDPSSDGLYFVDLSAVATEL
jgi:hypothetical protein